MVKPLTLSTTARAILTAAAERGDRQAVPPDRLPVAAQRSVARSMLNGGLLEAMPAGDGERAWHTVQGGRRQALRATEAGLAAVDAASGNQPAIASEASGEVAVASAARDEPAEKVALQDKPRVGTNGLRKAAFEVLVAWDVASDDRPALSGAIDALRVALSTSTKRKALAAQGGARLPRVDTKQAAVLALLRRAEGASGPQMAEATGWRPHTVRGFLAGLAKRGITVTVLDRVRQVGSGKAGAKGSYTIYRVAEAG